MPPKIPGVLIEMIPLLPEPWLKGAKSSLNDAASARFGMMLALSIPNIKNGKNKMSASCTAMKSIPREALGSVF